VEVKVIVLVWVEVGVGVAVQTAPERMVKSLTDPVPPVVLLLEATATPT